jgi:hypothetical protein
MNRTRMKRGDGKSSSWYPLLLTLTYVFFLYLNLDFNTTEECLSKSPDAVGASAKIYRPTGGRRGKDGKGRLRICRHGERKRGPEKSKSLERKRRWRRYDQKAFSTITEWKRKGGRLCELI